MTSAPTVAWLDVSLDFLVRRAGTVETGADRRLNAVQNLLGLMTEQWRASGVSSLVAT